MKTKYDLKWYYLRWKVGFFTMLSGIICTFTLGFVNWQCYIDSVCDFIEHDEELKWMSKELEAGPNLTNNKS